jgi:putative nucleotidyltransferase with HDIG domain
MSDSGQKVSIDEFADLPAMPHVMTKALEAIKNPITGLKQLGNIISVDQAISTKTLSLANSAFYGFRQQITSVDKALIMIGAVKAKNIIMSLALKQMMGGQSSRELWEHSLKCAVAAEYLALEYNGAIKPDDAFTVGFLHDIGKALLNTKDPVKYSKIKYIAEQNQGDLLELERTFFGVDHCTLGAALSKKWQLPVILTNCIKYHHAPTLSSLPAACGIIHIADKLVQPKLEDPPLDPQIMSKLGFTIDDPQTIKECVLIKAGILIREMGGS